jgi:hypothetical protein
MGTSLSSILLLPLLCHWRKSFELKSVVITETPWTRQWSSEGIPKMNSTERTFSGSHQFRTWEMVDMVGFWQSWQKGRDSNECGGFQMKRWMPTNFHFPKINEDTEKSEKSTNLRIPQSSAPPHSGIVYNSNPFPPWNGFLIVVLWLFHWILLFSILLPSHSSGWGWECPGPSLVPEFRPFGKMNAHGYQRGGLPIRMCLESKQSRPTGSRRAGSTTFQSTSFDHPT